MKKIMIVLSVIALLAMGTAPGALAGQDLGAGVVRPVVARLSVDATYYEHSDALFNYVEQLLPEYFPGHPQDQHLPDNAGDGPAVYRVYVNGNALATWWNHWNAMDVYYMLGSNNWIYFGSMDEVNQWICGGQCWGSSGSGSDAEVRHYVDVVLGMSGTTMSGGLTNQLQPILSALLGQAATTCPTVTTNLSLAGETDLNALLQNLPKPTLASVDYGSGCVTETGDTMSGRVDVRLDNLAIDSATQRIDVTFSMTASGLTKNSQVIADGTVGGNLGVNLGTATTGSGSIQMSNFLVPGGIRVSGTVGFGMLSSSSYTVNLDLSDSNNVRTQLALSANTASDGSQVISTTTPGTVNQYTVTLNSITYNDKVCAAYPIAGSAIFSTGGRTWTATFDSRCNGTYTLQ